MTEPTDRDIELAGEFWAALREGPTDLPAFFVIARAEGEAKGRREAIEECAKIADAERETTYERGGGSARSACQWLAQRIRDLAEPAEPK
jgi:pyruvate-formate lyase-activating enzyme